MLTRHADVGFRRTFPSPRRPRGQLTAAATLLFTSFSLTSFAEAPPAPSIAASLARPVDEPGLIFAQAAPGANSAAEDPKPTPPSPGAATPQQGSQPAPGPPAAPPSPPGSPPPSSGPQPYSGYPQGAPPPPQPSGPQPYSGYPQGAPPPEATTSPAAPPSYGPPPGARAAYNEPPLPPLPPPPQLRELAWSIRFDVLQLLFGTATGEVEYSFAYPFSVTVGPEFIFADPRRDRNIGDATGFGAHADLAVWFEGRALRGYYLKAHTAYRSVTFKSADAELEVPATKLGILFGSQSIYGRWFTVNGGLGVAYDFQSKDRFLHTGRGVDSVGRPVEFFYVVPASGFFGNGFDLLPQLQIGGSF